MDYERMTRSEIVAEADRLHTIINDPEATAEAIAAARAEYARLDVAARKLPQVVHVGRLG